MSDPSRTGRFTQAEIRAAIESDHRARTLEGCIVWVFLVLIVAAIVVALLGCSRSDDYDRATVTPAGYRVRYEDQGTIASGRMTGQEILSAFDAAMTRAAGDLAARYQIDPAVALAAPFEEKVVFHLADHAWFSSSGGGRAFGEWLGDTIIVAVHAHRAVPQGTPIPTDALPWTPLNVAGTIHYGVMDIPGFCPALAHELGHLLFGGGFEH